MGIRRRQGIAVGVGFVLFVVSAAAAVAAPLGRSVAASVTRCQVTSIFTVHPATRSAGEVANQQEPYSYEGTWVKVPLDAIEPFAATRAGELVDTATGTTPSAQPFPGQTWQVVTEARPAGALEAPYTSLPDDNFVLLLGFGGPTGSGGPPSTTMTWRWTVTYSVPGSACPTGPGFETTTEVNPNGSATQTTTPTATTPPAPTATATPQPHGAVRISFTKTGATTVKNRLHLVIVAPRGHTITAVKGTDGLSCSIDHGAGECTATLPAEVKVESVIVDLLPKVTGPLETTAHATTNTTTVDIATPPPALPDKHATLAEQIATLREVIDAEEVALGPPVISLDVYAGWMSAAGADLDELAAGFEPGSVSYDDLHAAAILAEKSGSAAALHDLDGGFFLVQGEEALKTSRAGLAALVALAGGDH